MREPKQITQKEAFTSLEYQAALEMMDSLPGLYFETVNKADDKIRIYLKKDLVWESSECAV